MALSVGSVTGSDPAGWTGMAGEIKKELWSKLDPGDPAKAPNPDDLSDICLSIATGVINHIISNMEIKGIKATLDTSLNTVFSAGVPVAMDGGLALQTAWKTATAAGAADDSTQNNDGTGRVA